MNFDIDVGELEEPAETVIHQPYISGYPDGRFQPERTTSREEVAKMIAIASESELLEYQGPMMMLMRVVGRHLILRR